MRVYEAVWTGLADSTVMDQKSNKIFEVDFDSGFCIEFHIKDLQNALDSSHNYNVATPFASLAMEILPSLKAHGHEKDDYSALARYYELTNDQKLQ